MNSYFTANTIHCGCQNIKSVFRALEIYNFGLSHATDFYDMPFALYLMFLIIKKVWPLQDGFFCHNKKEGNCNNIWPILFA